MHLRINQDHRFSHRHLRQSDQQRRAWLAARSALFRPGSLHILHILADRFRESHWSLASRTCRHKLAAPAQTSAVA
jgi:hypothetical protein